MRKKLLTLSLLCAGTLTLNAQPLQQAASNAFMVSRMVEKFHIQPRPLDDKLSIDFYTSLLETLDDQRIFFTGADITRLSAYRSKLDDEVRSKQHSFLQLLAGIYKERLLQTDTIVDKISKQPFKFSIKETLTAAEDTSFAADAKARQQKIYKLLKLSVLNGIVDVAEESGYNDAPSQKFIDSLEPVLRKRATATIKRSIKRSLQSPLGFDNSLGILYSQVLASCYDPHTAFLPQSLKDAYEGHLGKKTLEFGLSLDEDEEGNTRISALKPGSAAFQSGQLNEGDKIQAIQWQDREPIDVSAASQEEIGGILSAAGGNKAVLSVRKADGTTRQVTLHKTVAAMEDEEEKVQSFILQGTKKIGYISLPAFYMDWENSRGINGCANDVAKEIIKLKKENIAGLVLDLRYNGGGSMQEAIELAGIFIDAGPVGQVQTRDAKIISLKDINRGTIYDGPLLLLVNGFSASASEMVAATLQDYNRAIIAGSVTYGKATAQVILPMDTTVDLETFDETKEADNYIKLTVSRLYRVDGTTVQARGVIPHIQLPDPGDAVPQREADEKFAIPTSVITANKYYRPLTPLSLSQAEALAKKEIAASSYFSAVAQYIGLVKAANAQKDISLTLEDAWKANKRPALEEPAAAATETPLFTVTNHAYALQRLKANKDLEEMNDAWKENLLQDPYIKMAFRLLAAMGQ